MFVVCDATATPSSKHHRQLEQDPASAMKLQIAAPLIAALVYRAWSHKSLTPVGIATAFATAVVHAIHPWGVFFVLLAAFFLAGSAATKVRAS